MFAWKADRIAAREGLGRVLDLVALRPSWVQVLVFWAPLLLVAPVVASGAATGAGFNWQALVVGAAVSALLWWFVGSDRVAVCEGGLLLGGFAPFLAPFRVRWSEVDPATIAFVTPYRQVFRALTPGGGAGLGELSSARRGPAHDGVALAFAGPRIRAAALRGGMLMSEPVNTIHDGHLWFAGIGDERAERVRRAITQALAPLLGPAVAEVDARLGRPIRLVDDPRAAAHQIPGYRGR